MVYENELIASYINLENFNIGQIEKCIDITEELIVFKTMGSFTYNDKAIRFDFDLVTKGRTSQKISETNNIRGKAEDIFIEEGADVEFAYLNTNGGPYLYW